MFVAVVPPDAVLDHLDDFLDLRRDAADLRWSVRDQLHLTLAFLADVPDRVLDDFVLCDQEVLIRHLHQETAAWVEDYLGKTAEV